MAKKKIKRFIVKVKCGYRFFIGGKVLTCGDTKEVDSKDILGQENKLTVIKEL